MKRQQLAYVRVVALIMAGLVATLTIGNLFTITTKGITVYLPTEEDIHWSIDPMQKEIQFRTTFSVKNQGVYDINGISISAQLVKDNKTPLMRFEKRDMAALRGSNTTYELLIPLNLDTISFLDWFSLMYKKTTLKLLIDIDAQYMFGLIEFTSNEEINVPWSPPLLNFSNDTTIQQGLQGVYSLLEITQNTSKASFSNLLSVFSLFSLPEISYTTENGFSFSLTITSYSETVKNVTCHIVVPVFITSSAFEFTVSVLIGFEGGDFMFRFQEVSVQYVS